MKKVICNKWTLVMFLVVFGLVLHLLPHPANFVPIGAIALFSGLYLPKRFALIVPLIAIFISDLFIGFYSPKLMIAVYGSFLLMGIIGLLVRRHKTLTTVIGGTLFASVLFFLITNAAVWAFGTMYTHDITGLMQSYTMAIPFFRNSLLGDLFYVGVLVGGFELVYYLARSRRYPALGQPYSL